jgi:site-specific recombinase XerD
MELPEHLYLSQRILSIDTKTAERKVAVYLSAKTMETIFSMPDTTRTKGRRDLTLLCILYDTGARVQELVDLQTRDVRVVDPCVVTLTGKGGKARTIPIMTKTKQLLIKYMHEFKIDSHAQLNHPLFFNSKREKLTRAGVAYIVNKYSQQAGYECTEIKKTVTPHVFRHSKAMHLLQAKTNMFYIKDFLGHSDIETTEIYAKIDPEMKREALEKADLGLVPSNLSDWNQDKDLMSWLHSLL